MTARRKDAHPPKSPLGQAISYTLNQWPTLLRFLNDVRIPPDNNHAESALRVVALGRKNFLFVFDAEKGANLAGLYSLVSTCCPIPSISTQIYPSFFYQLPQPSTRNVVARRDW